MKKNKISKKIDSFWGISSKGSSIKIEIFAGIATFLAMAYILTVNPNSIIEGGIEDIRWASVFISTAIGAVIGTLLMAFLAKSPLAQASGMGQNSMEGGIIGRSITKSIGVGLISYVLIYSIKYLIDLIRFAFKKCEKPKWEISIIILFVCALFLIYFLVPTRFLKTNNKNI